LPPNLAQQQRARLKITRARFFPRLLEEDTALRAPKKAVITAPRKFTAAAAGDASKGGRIPISS
jgi:hypothetical protein